MTSANSVEDFVANPIGRHFVGTTHLFWCASPSLCGSIHWGRPTVEDARELTRLFEFCLHPALASGFDIVMDDRALELVEWSALSIFSDYVRKRVPDWARRARKHAVIIPSGVVGILLAGLVPIAGIKHPIRFFPQPADALDWIGRDDARSSFAQMERLVEETRGISALLRDLRTYLDGALVGVSVEAAARAMELSPRSLQRELRGLGTRFGTEVARARVRVACVALSQSDEKIANIAFRVGCSSPSQLSALFREELGETPAEYRERHRQS